MDLNRFKVAVLLATKDGAEFLPEQLESFHNQTHSNWELIVSDDGSVDATRHIIDRFAEESPQRVTRRDGPCGGFWRNFMSIAQDASIKSDFFAFSDQDDIWMPDKLERALRWLSLQSQDVPALYCGRTELIDREGAPLGHSRLFAGIPSFRNALVQNIGGGNTMVFNQAAKKLLEASAATEIVSHDWWIYQLVTATGGVVYYDPQPCVKYRQHGRNVVGANVGARARLDRIMALYTGRMIEWNDTNIRALLPMRHRLNPSNRTAFDQFSEARNSALPKRLRLLIKARVYRQHLLDNLGLFIGSIFGRI
jgi:glycosyltransferase involved in cell wall biosynthesis